jgi:hypothetical protein
MDDNRLGVSVSPPLTAPQTEFPYPLHTPSGAGSVASIQRSTVADPTVLPALTTSNTESTTPAPPTPGAPSPARSLNHVGNTPEKVARPVLPPKADTEAIKGAARASLPTLRRGTTNRKPSTNFSRQHFRGISDSDSSSSSSEDEWESDARKRKKEEDRMARAMNRMRGKDKRRNSSSAPYSKFNIGNEDFSTKGRVSRRDGRLKISVNETANTGYLAKALGAGVRRHFRSGSKEVEEDKHMPNNASACAVAEDAIENEWTRPKLNIVIMVIGTIRMKTRRWNSISPESRLAWGHSTIPEDWESFEK